MQRRLVHASRSDTVDQGGEGEDAGHEDPEPRDLLRRLHHAVERQHQAEHKGRYIASGFGVRQRCNEHMCKHARGHENCMQNSTTGP